MKIRYTAIIAVCLMSSVSNAETRDVQIPTATTPEQERSERVANILRMTPSYHRCILDNMKNVGSDYAAMRISEACMALEGR